MKFTYISADSQQQKNDTPICLSEKETSGSSVDVLKLQSMQVGGEHIYIFLGKH